MAQPTVTARPATLAGTSAPILYKLTSTNYALAGYRLEVEIWNATAAVKIADANYYPNSAGLISVDVSSFLKANMSLDNNSDLSTADVFYTDNNWLLYYIKYQEVWTASSETQVNDTGNQRYAIYGGLQIGNTNNLYTDYGDATPTKKFLTLMDRWRLVKGYPFTFSFFSVSQMRVIRIEDGVTLSITDSSISLTKGIRGKHKETGDADTLNIKLMDGTLSADESITMIADVIEDCNTVMLQWRNSLGGDECFPFQVNQEYTWHYSDRKAKRLTLYADNLTLTQWEAIQGLNTIGELYKTPITEMTTSLNRTMATIGQSVYVLNSDGSKTGVNVIGSPNTTNTKQKKHSAFVTIEYPELFLQ